MFGRCTFFLFNQIFVVQRTAFGSNAGKEDENESCQNERQMGQGSWAEAWQIGAGDSYILEEAEE